jgi:hypothetical protein
VPSIEPAQLLQAVVVDLAQCLGQRVAEEMDIAALPDGFGQDFANDRLRLREGPTPLRYSEEAGY